MPQREKGGAVNRGEFAHNFFSFFSFPFLFLPWKAANWNSKMQIGIAFPCGLVGKGEKRNSFNPLRTLREISLAGPHFSFSGAILKVHSGFFFFASAYNGFPQPERKKRFKAKISRKRSISCREIPPFPDTDNVTSLLSYQSPPLFSYDCLIARNATIKKRRYFFCRQLFIRQMVIEPRPKKKVC